MSPDHELTPPILPPGAKPGRGNPKLGIWLALFIVLAVAGSFMAAVMIALSEWS